MTAHMHVAHSRDRMMFLSAAVFSFLVAVQATLSEENFGETTVVLSEDTLLEINCTGTRTLTPRVAINGIAVSSGNATELLTSLGAEESVIRDSTGRLVLCFRLSVTSELEAPLTVECTRSSNYDYTLKFTDVRVHHPPPENVTGKYNSSAIQLQWNPPYSRLNNLYHEIFRIEPHIIQYTVYTADVCTGTVVGQVNTTETELTLNDAPYDISCLLYGVSTWNDGGAGETSVPVWGNLHHNCRRCNDTSTATPTTATPGTTVAISTAANSTEGDTTATSGDNQPDYTKLIALSIVGVLVASFLVYVVMTITVIFLQWMCNRKVSWRSATCLQLHTEEK